MVNPESYTGVGVGSDTQQSRRFYEMDMEDF
jgi:hypothetical protein